MREPLCRQPVSLWGSWKNRIPLLKKSREDINSAVNEIRREINVIPEQ